MFACQKINNKDLVKNALMAYAYEICQINYNVFIFSQQDEDLLIQTFYIHPLIQFIHSFIHSFILQQISVEILVCVWDAV